MTGECTRYQVVLMGSGGSGKTTILQKYLFGTANDKYKETVENLFIQRYTFNGRRTYIDFLDTAGSIPFPSMQEIYINKACGFILVYSITDQRSFIGLKQLWDRIKEARTDVLGIPCVIIGTNLDREEFRQVERFDALSWCDSENLGGCLIELSAKIGNGIDSIVNILLQQFGNRRADQWKPESVIKISKDVTNKSINKKKNKKKNQVEKNVRELNIRVGSQTIYYNDVVFQDHSDIDIIRRNTDDALKRKRIKPVEEEINTIECIPPETAREQYGFFQRMFKRLRKWWNRNHTTAR